MCACLILRLKRNKYEECERFVQNVPEAAWDRLFGTGRQEPKTGKGKGKSKTKDRELNDDDVKKAWLTRAEETPEAHKTQYGVPLLEEPNREPCPQSRWTRQL